MKIAETLIRCQLHHIAANTTPRGYRRVLVSGQNRVNIKPRLVSVFVALEGVHSVVREAEGAPRLLAVSFSSIVALVRSVVESGRRRQPQRP